MATDCMMLEQLFEPSPYLPQEILFNGREYWVHPINQARCKLGEYHHLIPELKLDDERFYSYFRMRPETFSTILEHVRPSLTKEQTGFRRPIPAEERLALTLRYLSTGMSFRSLAHSFRLGRSTVANIVEETVDALWSFLSPIYVKEPTRESYLEVADMYYRICNYPNCIGAIDGKHVRIQAPDNSGSNFFNYKSYFSIVLQGIADPELKFISVEVGAYGKESDGGIYSRSQIKRHLDENIVNLPLDAPLPNANVNLPYFLIGDAAYPLRPNLLTPFGTNLTHDRRIFNYRHSRARRCIECAFGVLAAKWRILKTAISTKVSTAEKIVLATVALHNAVIHHEGSGVAGKDVENWNDTQIRAQDRPVERFQGRQGQYASWVREELTQYFVGAGAVTWQEDYI